MCNDQNRRTSAKAKTSEEDVNRAKSWRFQARSYEEDGAVIQGAKKVAKENEATHPEAVFVKQATKDLCASSVGGQEELAKNLARRRLDWPRGR